MDIRKVKKLIEMLEESEVSEIEIHEGEESVRISRVGSGNFYPQQPQQVIQVADPATSAAVNQTVASEPAQQASAATEDTGQNDGTFIESPMVGIFYESPAPGKAAFVELGQSVKQGDVVCIIEAMKIMNQIEAETSGVVSKIMVNNGDPVEYGQPLFELRED